MKAPADNRNTDLPRAELYHAAPRSSWRRHRAAIRDRRARQRLPDNMPQSITVTDLQGRWVAYVPLRVVARLSCLSGLRSRLPKIEVLLSRKIERKALECQAAQEIVPRPEDDFTAQKISYRN
jgi:hypothetical protein